MTDTLFLLFYTTVVACYQNKRKTVQITKKSFAFDAFLHVKFLIFCVFVGLGGRSEDILLLIIHKIIKLTDGDFTLTIHEQLESKDSIKMCFF